MTKDEMRDILLSDFSRWQAREAEESNALGSRASLASYAEDQAALKGIGMVTNRGKARYSERWKPSKRSAYDRAESSGVEVYNKGKRTVVPQAHLSRRVKTI